ncbi:hypothetical protein QRD02_01490 [Aequorivita sp. SDUM287046]|uniref:DUF3137 domain-containing protein n=1 Tax=Aequorivita aurantiaca TaxID=3053356 RepID=A0ABT8DD04_9FLAO|nr:hypothetical protein [Aequorivita aurantiaca]MDN3723041.1 hypothetical protein [Aequorivita aurantiaca]
MNNNIRHLQPVANIKIIFAIVLSLFAIYLFFEGTLFGLILLGAALKLSLREGFELNLEEKEYRKVYSIFALNFGFWKNLPDAEYVSVFKTIKNSRARVITAEANLGFEVFKVNLFYSQNKHIDVYASDDLEDAFVIAQHIATVLELDIFDATKPEKRWKYITSRP